MSSIKLLIVCLVLVCLSATTLATTEVENGYQCVACKFFVGLVRNNIEKYNGTITAVFKKQVCGRLGKFESQCDKYVDVFGPRVIALIAAKLDPQTVCLKLNLCQSNKWFTELFTEEEAEEFVATYIEERPLQANKVKATPCDICQFVVQQAEAYLNQSEAEIEKQLVKACAYLPQQLEAICDTVVLVYGHQIVKMILEKATPEFICSKIGLCKNRTVTVEEQPEAVAAPSNDGKCDLCKFVVNTVEQYLTDNKTEKQIIDALQNVCAHLPSTFRPQCNSLVDEFLPYVIYYITQKYPADKVCTLIQFCSGSRASNGECPMKKIMMAQKAQETPKCMLCEFVIGEVEKRILKNATTEEAIIKALSQVCNALPKSLQGECNALVQTFGPVIAKKIMEKASPSEICKLIGFCTKKVVAIPAANDQTCDTCVAVVTFVENYIQSNTTSKKIIEALTKACDYVPSQYTMQCKFLVPLVWAQMIQYIQQKEQPQTVCKQLHLCPQLVEPRFSGAAMCAGCKQLVTIASNFLTKESTETEIITFVEQLCDYVPQQFQPMCNAVIEQYGKQVIEQFVQKYFQPEQVCKAVRACDAMTTTPISLN